MKILRYFPGLILTILVFSAAATTAQDKSKVSPLPENASLEETQKWLTKEVKKFSKYKSNETLRSESGRISEIKFEGCRMTYQVVKTVISEKPKTREGSSADGPSMRPFSLADFYTVFFFDLTKMDAGNISERISNRGETKTIILNTTGGANDVTVTDSPEKISFGDGDRNKKSQKEDTQNRALVTVKAEAAEQIKAGFSQAIKLCQAANQRSG